MRKAGLSEEENRRIEEAIDEAEGRTRAKILTYITDSSAQYSRAEDVVGLLLSGLIMIGISCKRWLDHLSAYRDTPGGHDIPFPHPSLLLSEVLIIGIAAFVLGVLLARVARPLKRFLVNIRRMEEEVQGRALLTLREGLWARSDSDPVLLIYVSRFEGMVEVVGDQELAHKAGLETLMSIRGAVVKGWREGSLAEGLRNGIVVAGELLERTFPIGGDEQAEGADRASENNDAEEEGSGAANGQPQSDDGAEDVDKQN